MNHLERFKRDLLIRSFFAICLPVLFVLGSYVALREFADMSIIWALVGAGSLCIAAVTISFLGLAKISIDPLEKVWQAIWHASPNKQSGGAPRLESVKVGRELVSSMVMEVYDLASSAAHDTAPVEQTSTSPQPVSQSVSVIESVPLPLFILNKDHAVTASNLAAATFLNTPREKITGKSIYDVLRLSFSSEDTFDNWLQSAADRATDSHSWEHVKLNLEDGTLRQFDMAASYSKDSPSGNEVVIALFDRSHAYSKEDQATSYVALAVHELRTPLTMLRGYIEVFEDELGDQLTPEHKEFMRKMSAAAQGLTAFVSNILNVARIDENQFVLSLHEANWNTVLPEIIKDLELRASVRGKNIELTVEPNLPSVAIDKISVYEVLSNLIDNAIKYSGQSIRILVSARLGQDGMVETTVQDFGLGIPESAIGGLFTKYYRSHHSRNAVGGSGLGLYLVKSIISAHGGNVWVSSKEGEGSSFTFTLQPFSQAGARSNDADGIERQASGWIKNHSMYRR